VTCLLDGERIVCLTETQSGLSLEKKLAPADAVVRQKEKRLGAFEAALAGGGKRQMNQRILRFCSDDNP
jgi:hypothetical protein